MNNNNNYINNQFLPVIVSPINALVPVSYNNNAIVPFQPQNNNNNLVSTTQVCPTCLRPFDPFPFPNNNTIDSDDSEIENEEPLNNNNEKNYYYYYSNSEAEEETPPKNNTNNNNALQLYKKGRRYNIINSNINPFHFRALEQQHDYNNNNNKNNKTNNNNNKPNKLLPLPPIPTDNNNNNNNNDQLVLKDLLSIQLETEDTTPPKNNNNNNNNDHLFYTYLSPTRRRPDSFDHSLENNTNNENNNNHHFSLNGYYNKYFYEVKQLGSGSFGGVYLCHHHLEHTVLGTFALKKIPVGEDHQYLKNVLQEVKMLTLINNGASMQNFGFSSSNASFFSKKHPNILEYYHSWIEEETKLSDFGPPVKCLYILMEYATEGSLDSYLEKKSKQVSMLPQNTNHNNVEEEIKNRRNEKRKASPFCLFSSNNNNNNNNDSNIKLTLSNNAVWLFFLSALAGINYLHEKGIIHRDLKPQNLLLTYDHEMEETENNNQNNNNSDEDSSDDEKLPSRNFSKFKENQKKIRKTLPRVLVSDFGTATLLSDLNNKNNNHNSRTGGTGTQEYMAPELFIVENNNNNQNNNNITYKYNHSKKSDVWSLGMILYYLCTNGQLPPRQYHENNNNNENSPFEVLIDENIILKESIIPRPTELIQLLKVMLQTDPKKRPSCKKILFSSVIQNILMQFNQNSESGNAHALFVVVDTSTFQNNNHQNNIHQNVNNSFDWLNFTPALPAIDNNNNIQNNKTLENSRVVEIHSSSVSLNSTLRPVSYNNNNNNNTISYKNVMKRGRKETENENNINEEEKRKKGVDAGVQTDG